MLPEPLSPAARLPWEEGLAIEPAEPGLPGVSIVIPIFNAGAFLEKTLRSLMCNDLTGVELILMDGGSTDTTAAIVEHYRDILAVAVSEPDRGQSDAINKGFARATQPILYWLNGDDILLPNALVAVRRAFRDDPEAEVVVGDAWMTEIDFAPIRHFRFSPATLAFDHLLDYAANHLIQPSVFFTRTAWEAAGPVKEELHYAMDADLFLGMARRFRFRHIPVDIGYSVYHEACKTRGKRAESITELALVQARHGGFDQARRTLDILVGLFNEAEARAAAPGPAAPAAQTLLERRLQALQEETEKNRALLIDLDMKLTA
jgi:glycosyltransferase involved in cell wall biosynthesis